jgi:hypothetical protein
LSTAYVESGRLLERSHDLESEVHRMLGGDELQLFDDAPRMLVKPLPSAGISMMRLQHEALTRAVWLQHAAFDEQISRLVAPLDAAAENAASRLPMAKTMLDEIVGQAPQGAVEMITHFKDVNAPDLHSFVHGGIHAIRRGLTGYPVELLANVVRGSNGLYTMAGMLLAILSGDEALAKRMSKIQPRFADCLPPLVAPVANAERDARLSQASRRGPTHGTVCCAEPTPTPAQKSCVPTREPASDIQS